MHQLITSGNHSSLIDFAHAQANTSQACTNYTSSKNGPKCVIPFKIPQQAHSRDAGRIIWGLGTCGHRSNVPSPIWSSQVTGPKSSSQQLGLSAKDMSKQYCCTFSYGKCPHLARPGGSTSATNVACQIMERALAQKTNRVGQDEHASNCTSQPSS